MDSTLLEFCMEGNVSECNTTRNWRKRLEIEHQFGEHNVCTCEGKSMISVGGQRDIAEH